MRRAAFAAILLLAGACRPPDGDPPFFAEPVRVNDLDGGAGQSEPTIAVDPTGETVLVAWIDWSASAPHVRLARSTDGGTTFAASEPVHAADPDHPRGQAEATLAHAGGRFAAGWIGCRPDSAALENHACDVYVKTSADGGRSWAPPVAIAEGGPDRRDRPWVIADGDGFAVAWTEVGAHGSRWKLAKESAPDRWTVVATRDGRAAVQPPSPGKAGLEAMLLDRTSRNPREIVVEQGIAETPVTLGTRRWSFPPEAALLPYSLGAFATRPEGDAWIAIPAGNGEDSDLRLFQRGGALATYRPAGTVRGAAARRVGLPWITALTAPGRFLLAWIEEAPDGWHVRARLLGPGARRSRPADLSRGAFRFQEASLTRNVGDFLGAASAGDAFWVVWSDTRDGDADIRLARGRAPEGWNE